jgi:hypothetical protein
VAKLLVHRTGRCSTIVGFGKLDLQLDYLLSSLAGPCGIMDAELHSTGRQLSSRLNSAPRLGWQTADVIDNSRSLVRFDCPRPCLAPFFASRCPFTLFGLPRIAIGRSLQTPSSSYLGCRCEVRSIPTPKSWFTFCRPRSLYVVTRNFCDIELPQRYGVGDAQRNVERCA